MTQLKPSETELDWIDVYGPRVKFLSSQDKSDGDFSVIMGILDPGVVIPLHAHEDRETFIVLSGQAEGYVNAEWQQVGEGNVLDVPSGSAHAWRNRSSAQATVLIVTSYRMKEFFSEIGHPVSQDNRPPSPEELSALAAAAKRYDYWMAPPEKNAEIGIILPI